MEPITSFLVAAHISGSLWPLVRDKLQDMGTDFLKDAAKEKLKGLFSASKDPEEIWQKAANKALADSMGDFIYRSEAALVYADVEDVGAYAEAFACLLASGIVQEELALTFLGQMPDQEPFVAVWQQMGLRALPDGFSWPKLLKNFQSKMVEIVSKTPVLASALTAYNSQRTADGIEAMVPRTPGYNLSYYRQALISTHGGLKLQNLAAESQTKTPISMRKIFVNPHVIEQSLLPAEFYCLPIEDQTRLREGGLREHHALSKDQLKRFAEQLQHATPQPGLAFVTAQSQRLVVLTGDPGSGKSTFLQFLALEWAERPVPAAGPGGAVPYLIELRRYAEQRATNGDVVKDFPSYLQHGTGQLWQLEAKQVEKTLETGEAWLFLDGFDEVFDTTLRGEIVACIGRAVIAWPQARIVLTTRPYGYKPEALRDQGFLHAHVQPFDGEQIATFLGHWHGQIEDANRDERHERLTSQLSRQPRLRELAGNPLLLTMMALLNRTSRLPDQRADLYSRCVDLLVHQWEAEVHQLPGGPVFGGYSQQNRELSLNEKRDLLRAVAFHMQTVEGALALNVVDAAALQLTLATALPAWVVECDRPRVAEELVGQLQGRNFILASLGGGRFGFVHRTFLEFCCADYYLFQVKEEGSLSNEALFSKAFAPHWRDEAWREVLLLIASQLKPARLKVVLELMLQEKADEYESAPRFAAHLLGEAEDREVHVHAAEEVWNKLVGAVNKVGEVGELNVDIFQNLQWTLTALCKGWAGDAKLQSFLKTTILSHPKSGISTLAVYEMAREWAGDPTVRSFLESLLEVQPSPGNVVGVANSLAEYWPRDERMFSRILMAANNCPRGDISADWCWVLTQHWPGEPRVRRWLLDFKEPDDGYMHGLALTPLVENWPGDAEVHAYVIAKATKAKTANWRREALYLLARYWPVDTDTRTALEQAAGYDPEEAIRNFAQSLLENLPAPSSAPVN